MADKSEHTKAAANGSIHKAVVREEFTRQAEAYAKAEAITNAQRLERLVTATNPASDARALEVATGPGYVAMALAAICREVVGLDLTPAPIAIAERNRQERNIKNVRFQVVTRRTCRLAMESSTLSYAASRSIISKTRAKSWVRCAACVDRAERWSSRICFQAKTLNAPRTTTLRESARPFAHPRARAERTDRAHGASWRRN